MAFILQLLTLVPHPPSGSSQSLASFVWSIIALLFGWTLFLYWWGRVIDDEHIGVFIDLFVMLGVLLAVVGGATALWIAHNQRIARKGTRGRSTRYNSHQVATDRLDRELLLPSRPELMSAARIVVHSNEMTKTYLIDREEKAV